MSNKKKIKKQYEKYLKQQKEYVESLQRQLLPGQKLMTCQCCGKICRMPEWAQVVTCIRSGGIVIAGPAIHPGEIKFYKIFLNMN